MEEKAKQYIYYFLIGIMSFIALAFLPMLGSSVKTGWALPQTSAGWALWIMSRISVSSLNVLIFHCFVKQGDLNTKTNASRLLAEEKLRLLDKRSNKAPLSPHQFFRREYGKKIPVIFTTTALSLIAFGPAILIFDIVVFVSYLATVIMALVFGILEMKKVEAYYTEGLLNYALYREKVEGVNND